MDIERLYQTYGPMVLRRCRALLKNEDEALDVAQDVFVRVMQSGGIETMDYPSSYLYTAATNLSLNRLRDKRRRGEVPGEDLLTQIADLHSHEERVGARRVLNTLFKRTPETTRLIAVLHFVDGLTLEETAREVGMSVSGIRKRLRGLRATLKGMDKP